LPLLRLAAERYQQYSHRKYKIDMKKIGIILLLFLTFAFTKKDESADFVYKVKLYPSFAPYSEISIKKIGKSGKISLTILDNSYPNKKSEYSAKLDEADFGYFAESLNDISLSEMESDSSMGNDGMTFRNTFIQNGKTTEFEFWSPKKDSKYHKIADVVISLLKRKFTGKYEQKYFAELDKYY
jgi:hypothetical protein